IRFVDLDAMALDRELAQVIDRDLARRFRVVPIGRGADHVTVAMDDPADHSAIGALWVAAGCRVEVVTTTGAALRRAFSRVYGDRPAAAEPAAPAARTLAPGDMQARHSETVRKLTALRVASERVRHDLDAGA